ncbi:MAG: histidine--tRNA ligase [Rhodospirillaceae bacterium]|nr:histidine--tRNA ligase [Rhodospirillaceae bacterium]MBT5240058.1 histidine--tRNA ligase [Rhodospirillaceae bacterium]MBT5564514.1 histidine--tRNA ligase [Rhodospirillaceae bacterium]MBT6088053.1 histidine--tRNA ligase [Rhodospirillaceae bacterium]
MTNLQPVRGTHDLLPDDRRRHRHVESLAQKISGLYGFEEVATPIFEFTDVFVRTLGDTSDIVTKEMYTFETKGGESVTLRPEGTAGVARAFISNGLAQHVPVKVFYTGPMFRHERPQKGRQRQFHQIGVELIGVEGPQADIEVIALGHHILKELGILESTTLEINSLGDVESRTAFRAVLTEYFQSHESDLSEDSRNRLVKNPLRILDSKDEGDRKIVAGAPDFAVHLNDTSKAFIDTVLQGLTDLGIPFERNPKLVRGLDYYCHTAFEFTTTELGAQSAVLAGGRYDGLIEQMGGPSTPGVGWAAGIERLAMLAGESPARDRPISVIPVSADLVAQAQELAQSLRNEGFFAEFSFTGNMKRRLKRADKSNARAALILGEDELKDGKVMLRDLDSGEQEAIPLGSIVQTLHAKYN